MSIEDSRLFKTNASLVFFVFISFLILYHVLSLVQRHTEFEKNGVEIQAVPTACSYAKNGQRELSYRYEIGGLLLTGEDIVNSPSICDAILASGVITIRYLANDPSESEYQGVVTDGDVSSLSCVSIFLLGGFFLLLKSRQHQLYEMAQSKKL